MSLQIPSCTVFRGGAKDVLKEIIAKLQIWFPYKMRPTDGVNMAGIPVWVCLNTQRWWTCWAVCSRSAIIAWRGHLDVEIVTWTGLEWYLINYVKKIEPTFGLKVPVDQLSESDLLSLYKTDFFSCMCNLSPIMPCSYSPKNCCFVDTNRSGNRRCFLKPLPELYDMHEQIQCGHLHVICER